MICGIGIDMVEIARIRRSLGRFGEHFIQKILAPEEVAYLYAPPPLPSIIDAQRLQHLAPRMAARFAAKEAAGKALGTGLAVGLHSIHIYTLPTGQPSIHFFGAAAQRMRDLGATHAHISLSHERAYAVAMVVIEKG